MSERAAPATIRDVAKRAGVSTATVSRVLAGIGNPKAETADAVMAAVDELDFRPSAVARSLRMRRTNTFGGWWATRSFSALLPMTSAARSTTWTSWPTGGWTA
jgi:DNA-binding LacI/PurR family transcriptional regulator